MHRSNVIQIRVSDEEKQAIQRTAEFYELKVSEWLRRVGVAEAAKTRVKDEEPIHFDIQPQADTDTLIDTVTKPDVDTEKVRQVLTSAKCRCGATRQAGAMCPNCKWVAR